MIYKQDSLTRKRMIERRELPGMKDLKCPKCGSEHIRPLRGEITGKHTAHECKCTNCDCDFLVSSSTMLK